MLAIISNCKTAVFGHLKRCVYCVLQSMDSNETKLIANIFSENIKHTTLYTHSNMYKIIKGNTLENGFICTPELTISTFHCTSCCAVAFFFLSQLMYELEPVLSCVTFLQSSVQSQSKHQSHIKEVHAIYARFNNYHNMYC